ncbi:C40 family peptidase [Psychrobacillus vulpis]|uniref:LysM peptidoglycan-binding domain-containing protein n=1 Tax=Psychrobacillus vulpis TaxID=2325572 RepID=A0A544TJ24_9BACI|nr:C40 family peptidase [Psychrobacillus vulpis]TQR17388.1 LysM peptidoglycan-binding domain-containing protein [Psychrobacillus vulpis]
MIKKFLIVMVLFFSFSATANADTLHEVKKGDSLSKIAKMYKVTVNDLRTWNKLKKDNIYIKQKIIVQKPTNVKTATKPVPKPVGNKPVAPIITEIIVQPGQVKSEQVVNPPVLVDEAKQLTESGQAIYLLLLDIAPRLEGIPYLYAGNTIAGFDCSGFIHFIHSQAGLNLTRKSSESYFAESATVVNPIVGDLVFFENTYKEGISHMGIYLGNNEFIHAGTKGVEIARLDSVYWKDHFVSFKRFHSVSVN